jgi:hypothetical protein
MPIGTFAFIVEDAKAVGTGKGNEPLFLGC